MRELCKICNDNGCVLFYKLVNGYPYEYIAYCECQKGVPYRYKNSKNGYDIPCVKQIELVQKEDTDANREPRTNISDGVG